MLVCLCLCIERVLISDHPLFCYLTKGNWCYISNFNSAEWQHLLINLRCVSLFKNNRFKNHLLLKSSSVDD